MAMDRGQVFSDQCPSRDVLRHVTSRWGALTLLALLAGTQRFSDLRRRIKGISEKMLAETLQAQEADGFVQRIAHPVVPPHVDYALTPMGREIAQRVEGMTDWIEGNLPRIQAAQEQHKAQRRR
ncbi:winged helix-turn-helix transcriptional regulator [Phaeovulum sp. W22_SRMD_FR3]|uniref:winged helix-turn-helix transcriptional regulator n=1 Tax=Phaeovulum sp. W22_SRMD_FR3 TaxID=3240274 RepID=UPI003F986C7A